MDLIRISKAQLAYGTHPLLDNADAVIESGERVCIVGRNGCLLYTSPSPRDS